MWINKWKNEPEIKIGLHEYDLYKNPEIVYTEYGDYIRENSIMQIEETMRKSWEWSSEPLEDTTPFDDEGDVCVERFFDLNGKLKSDVFKELRKFEVEGNTYQYIYLPYSETNKSFLIDFRRKKVFPALSKGLGASAYINDVVKFGNQEAVILSGGIDTTRCIGEDGKQIGEECIDIEKYKNGKIDILGFRKRVNPDYSVNDMRTYREYIGSDGLQYDPVPLSEKPQFPFRLKNEKVLEYQDPLEIE